MKKITFLFILFITSIGFSQVTITPNPFDISASITISLDANSTATDCNGLSNPTKVYMHSGVGSDTNAFDISVVGNWGLDDGVGEMTLNTSNNRWEITFVPKTYFSLTDAEATSVTKMGIVFRNATGTQEMKDNGCSDFIFNVGSFQLTLNSPSSAITVLNSGESLSINATASLTSSFVLKANGAIVNQNSGLTYSYSPTVTENTTYLLEATNNGETKSSTFQAVVKPTVTEAAVPSGMKDGINLNSSDPTKATLVFYAPTKEFVHLIGNFNNWELDDSYLLKKDSSNDRFWIELTGLTAQTDYTYQYMIDADLRVADPYSTIILNEYNDQYIDATTYPNLPSYPSGKTNHAVTLLRTGDTEYTWQTTNFQKPAKTDLVIYEILIRDFDALHSYDAVKARLDYLQDLGINAIEFMPVMEFDGNESWGYNPSFHMALDKYYGNATSFKQFIDECHRRGMAVIIDVAFNHASGQNPYYRMWNTDNGGYGGQASTDSPFFNPIARHSYSVFNDFNHSKQATKDYVKRVSQYWIDEYKIDGFRWDLTKGFTQNCTGSDACTNAYQQDRVDVLKGYADDQWEIDPNFYIIFEHLGTNDEETQWVNYRLDEGKGIMVWGNHNSTYNQATMGFGASSDFSWISYLNRGWTVPANVSYMESHDEERLMYKNLQFGNSSGSYNIKTLTTALDREELAGAFYFTVPGPKMIWQFGELGYDISIDENGRTGNKPIKWEYFDIQARKDLYNTWAKLIKLKLKYDIFQTSDFTLDVANTNGLKKIHLTNPSATDIQNIVIIGNFGVTTQSISPFFQQTGTWYSLLEDNATINVTSTTANISLAPGEFKMYANSPATLSSDDITLENNTLQMYPNPTSTAFYLSKEALDVKVFDITGKQVKQFAKSVIKNNTFSVTDLNTGIYFVRIKENDNKISTKKLIIN
ncbi:Por secretion system C-terminal sorting domain-containing protein [Polaribacter sp. KT25b]|uniref:alpha-amylase family glycosyl hydrolase n=1 Tax=Polaribacter sp. KT25b TaxID=1855336 RepID=UPI00087BC685|nr:alpha-amylase family glycosyl hydrolase [Polaribacter sp. KT25b]SDS08589.1 Por secretion system C-terminal sorting domain-containing protein [Polaribacter sp. KT25b]